ncbi:FmdE family protein [Methanosphaerula palustris]|uniref:Formylmethanofuran dehydrogenase subunit E region n=1 Tax=Methanosphaerula palustris (strain ATCC BAA-1556 / DSM 19958 / E1-9c) TaxID=521011 RepID=B8GKB6_METPE|nr:FmdE family protein [Methanosphaerula palustris]ACL15799.1 formylmethanofuran dehydrogenase subunit E region [Methanosphaerula palustris E1-9c]
MSNSHQVTPRLPTFEEAVAFHGHRCPGLALGYRAAVLGMAALGPRRSEDEEIVTVVENDACGVDGVQVVTGCTFGKGNLIFHDYGKHVYTFINRKTGDAVRIVTRVDFSTGQIDPQFGDIRERARRADATPADQVLFEDHLAGVCEAILTIDPARIFLITRPVITPPEEARIYRSRPCDRCGELVAEPKGVHQAGRFLCVPCSRND